MWVLFLLAAWTVAFAACARLSHAASGLHSRAGPPAVPLDPARPPRSLTLYEAAFLSGGPCRVADVTLVAMTQERRMLLAHTGWATVVDPEGHDDVERSVITAIGPGGQSRIDPVRAALTADGAVQSLAERLTADGLAVPEAVRNGITAATRQVRVTAVLILVAGLAAEFLEGAGSGHESVAPWFALPLVLTLGALAVARYEIGPANRWASPAGERRLREDAVDTRDGDGALLTALALRGPGVLPQAELRAALGDARAPLRER